MTKNGSKRNRNKPDATGTSTGGNKPSDIVGTSVGTGADIRDESSSVFGTSAELPSESTSDGIESDGNVGANFPNAGNGTGDSGGIERKRGRGRPRGSGGSGGDRSNRRNSASGGGTTNSTEENASAEDISEVPGAVNYDNLFKFPAKTGRAKKHTPTDTVAKTLTFLYRLPMYWGFGDHWPLDSQEAKDYAESWVELYDSLPKKQQTWLMKWLQQYAPLATFSAMFVTINAPRIAATKQVYERRKMVSPQTRNDISGNTFSAQDNVTSVSGESVAATPFARSIKNNFASRIAGNDQ